MPSLVRCDEARAIPAFPPSPAHAGRFSCSYGQPAGFAESAVVSYVISNGKKASNAADLARALVGAGLPAGSETHGFAAELIGRIPRAGTAVSAYKQQERAALAATVQNRRASHLMLVQGGRAPSPWTHVAVRRSIADVNWC